MGSRIQEFDPRQEMRRTDYEISHKRDTYLTDIELHHHDFYEVDYLVSGDVTYAIESRIYRAIPGDLLLIGPKELHQLSIQSDMAPYERYVLWIAPSLLHHLSTEKTDLCRCFDTGRPDYGNLLRLSPEKRHTIHTLMESIQQETEAENYGGDILHNTLLAQLMVFINRLAAQDAGQFEDTAYSSQMVSKVIRYINLHYGEPLSLDMLAERFFVSKYHLSHEFQHQVGTSLYRYIQKKRLLNARQLLAQGKKPGEVYGICGFGDYTGFYRAFKAEYGSGPREYAFSVRQWNQDEDKV